MLDKWTIQKIYLLNGTDLELHPQYGISGFYYIVKCQGKKEKVLAGPLPLAQAKKTAERMATG
jgi:hypothetical protein